MVSDDPARLDERRLLRLNPAADTVETVTTWDEYGGQLLGTWVASCCSHGGCRR